MKIYRRRCRFCWHYFQSSQASAKFCSSKHRFKHWEKMHPRQSPEGIIGEVGTSQHDANNQQYQSEQK
jgi:hypothetical protein